ncbi:MAG TPA: hypothetical protein VFG42_03555 [Baekduia sp.]|uniref:hypothetical protein n=1 Tax=Baekduia sp. TaxID=2600305 RepID=UPI002D771416|nr:hypothetical protein [Baekduia sp.]HET6505843.1 hypothetical protein [Baekduia sp.]
MKRLSRHTVVVLLVALGVCLGGMSVAVVAFGQTPSGDPDATVPLGDYTTTTPSTTPTSSYTTPTSSTTPTVTTTPTETGTGTPTSTHRTKPQRTHGTSPGGSTRTLPSTATATRPGPTHLAFTGGEPIFVGVAGAGLMLAGLALHRRRQRRAA